MKLLACLALVVVLTCSTAEAQEHAKKAKPCKKMCKKSKHASVPWEAKCDWKKCGGCSECTNPCEGFKGSFAYSPDKISAGLLEVMSKDEKIIKANACNVCPDEGTQPVWIAPGDICTLKDMPEAHFDHCKTAEWADDYKPADHVKACLTMAQIDELWLTGHCHNTSSTLPFVRKEGLLFCSSVGQDGGSCTDRPCGKDLYCRWYGGVGMCCLTGYSFDDGRCQATGVHKASCNMANECLSRCCVEKGAPTYGFWCTDMASASDHSDTDLCPAGNSGEI